MSRIDASGWLASQVISHVLNWQPGDRLTLTADAGVVVARRDPHGMVSGTGFAHAHVRLVMSRYIRLVRFSFLILIGRFATL
jgi:hypothetical protein